VQTGPPAFSTNGYNVRMTRIWPVAAALALGCVAAAAASSADRPPITQAASGKVVRLARGENAALRLSNRWRWSEPHASTAAVELTPVEYFVDPGFREWTIDARKSGRATIRSLGRPRCSTCALETRRFAVTIDVAAG
jgi:predicted secreted protein